MDSFLSPCFQFVAPGIHFLPSPDGPDQHSPPHPPWLLISEFSKNVSYMATQTYSLHACHFA